MSLSDHTHEVDFSIDRSVITQKILQLTHELKEMGIHAEYHTDFALFRDVVEGIADRGHITAIYDTDRSDTDSHNAFWIKGLDDDGNVVHVQAMRYHDMSTSNLADHWQSDPYLYSPAGLEIDLAKSDFETAPISHSISGGVCYHGDFWIDKKHRKYGLAPKLSQYALLFALTRFLPDYIYCFVVPKQVKRGLAVQYGYLHIHPWAPRWHVPGKAEPYDDYLVWITGRELAELWSANNRDADMLGQVGQDDDARHPVFQSVAGD